MFTVNINVFGEYLRCSIYFGILSFSNTLEIMMPDYLCDDGKPYQWSADVIAAGLDHDHIDYFPSGWKSQTDAERDDV